jgi:hypothetical protein
LVDSLMRDAQGHIERILLLHAFGDLSGRPRETELCEDIGP